MRVLWIAIVLTACSPPSTSSSEPEEPPVEDPYQVDADRDGHSDGAELDWGSDPLDCTSVPGDREWPNCLAEALEAPVGLSGWGLDQQSPNWSFVDQHGEAQAFWRFRGTVLVLEIWPFW